MKGKIVKRLKFLFVLLLAFLFVMPGYARPFGQAKNNFTGVQYFEGGIILGAEADSLDTLTYVSNDTTLADQDSTALITEYAAGKALDKKVPYEIVYGYLMQPTATSISNTITYNNSNCDSITVIYSGVGNYTLRLYPSNKEVAFVTICSSYNSAEAEGFSVNTSFAGEYVYICTGIPPTSWANFDTDGDGIQLHYKIEIQP